MILCRKPNDIIQRAAPREKKMIWQTKDRQAGSYIHHKMPDV